MKNGLRGVAGKITFTFSATLTGTHFGKLKFWIF
jgi:hypothetical protein